VAHGCGLVVELPPWIIEDLKQQHKRERLHQDNQPRVELPLPEPPPDEKEDGTPERVVDL
jgi:hypothetical protein